MSTYVVKDFVEVAEQLWPQHTKEPWDQVGLSVGNLEAQLQRVLLAVDAVRETVDEAIHSGADLLFTHHPLLLHGAHSVAQHTGKGSLIASLIAAQCALFSAHTNADQPDGGVSSVLAKKLGLHHTAPIVDAQGPTEVFGLGRVGELAHTMPLREFAERVADVLPGTVGGVRVAGDPQRLVQRVAVMGGAGDSLLDHPRVLSADVYLTSDLRHHPAQEFVEQSLVAGGPALIDVSHWSSESLWLEGAAAELGKRLPGVEFVISALRTDPWTFAAGQVS